MALALLVKPVFYPLAGIMAVVGASAAWRIKAPWLAMIGGCASACDAGIYDPEFEMYRVFSFFQHLNRKLVALQCCTTMLQEWCGNWKVPK